MRKAVYLTFDIETIVTGYSYNPTYYASVFLGAMYIAHELKKRGQKGTFYISLSPKARHIRYDDYLECLDMLIEALKAYENVRLAPHIHAYNLPLPFKCPDDHFSAYNYDQQVQLLLWAKEFFRERGLAAEHFRPGGYNINDSYYQALKAAGYASSSVLLKDEKPNINLLTREVLKTDPLLRSNGILEYPVTSLLIKSVKGGSREIVNLSPDFFTINSVKDYIQQLDYINMNFHSFSVFLNRMARENHKGQLINNLTFFFAERLANRLLRKFSIETIRSNVIFRKELLAWLDFFQASQYQTKFIGE